MLLRTETHYVRLVGCEVVAVVNLSPSQRRRTSSSFLCPTQVSLGMKRYTGTNRTSLKELERPGLKGVDISPPKLL